MTDMSLPPRGSVVDDSSDKVFKTALSSGRYQKLSQEGLQRGCLSVYKLAQIVLSHYVDKKLIIFDDLPVAIQQQIREFYAKPA